MSSGDEISRQLAELSARIASLEAAVQRLEAMQSPHPLSAPPPPPRPTIVPAGVRGRAPSLESRIGAQLLNRIGIAAVLIGMAWFLKLAFDRNWIGPGIRILIGLVCAAALVVWSERFRRQAFPAFSYSLKALGTGIAYLSLWAASSIFHLAPWWLVFAAMAGVTIAIAILARRQSSEVLAIYALAGGLATPGLLSVGHGDPLFLFAYLALLNGGALLLLAGHPWTRLAWAALLGTAGYYIGWTVSNDSPSPLLLTAGFLGLLFAGFAAVPFLLLRQSNSLRSSLTSGFPIANALATWVGVLVLFATAAWRDTRPWATLLLALACLLLARAPGPAALARTHLGLGIFFVTAAVPLQFHGYAVNQCWLAEALALVVVARITAGAAIRICAAAVLTLAMLALVWNWFGGPAHPVAVMNNMNFATSMVGAGVFAAVVALSVGKLQPDDRPLAGWSYLAGFATIAFGLTVLLAVCLEIHHYWFCGAGFFRDYCGGYGQLEHRSIAAEFDYSACCMVYGAVLITAGFLRRSAFLRWQALALFAFSIAMVFLNGVTHQGQGFRVLSFLGLGVLLLVVSFAYQRDWLRLRS